MLCLKCKYMLSSRLWTIGMRKYDQRGLAHWSLSSITASISILFAIVLCHCPILGLHTRSDHIFETVEMLNVNLVAVGMGCIFSRKKFSQGCCCKGSRGQPLPQCHNWRA